MTIFIIIVCGIIFAFNLRNYYSITKLPPSDMWSKELKIGKCDSDIVPKIIEDKDNILVAYKHDKKIIVNKRQLNGNNLYSKEYPCDVSDVKNLMLLKKSDNYYVIYNYGNYEEGNLQVIALDTDLNEIERTDYTNVFQTYQINSTNAVFYHSGTVSYYDTENDIKTNTSVDNVTSLSGAKCGDKIMISYFTESEESCNVEGFTVDNGTASEPLIISNHGNFGILKYTNLVSSGDKDYCYIVYFQILKDVKLQKRIICYNLNENTFSEEELCMPTATIVGGYSPDSSSFYCTEDILLTGKSIQSDLVYFSMKDGKPAESAWATRLREGEFNYCSEGDYLCYLSFHNGNCNLYVTSTNESFKNMNNGFKTVDLTSMANLTVEVTLTGFCYLLVLGVFWIMPSMCFASVGSLITYDLKEKYKLIFYIFIAVITLVFKLYFLNKAIYYGDTSGYPAFLSNPLLVFTICSALTAITFLLQYITFNDRKDYLMVGKVSAPIFIDALFTCMIFIPIVA